MKPSKVHDPITNNDCQYCNSDLDEKYTEGLWDLSGEICEKVIGNATSIPIDEVQDEVYNALRRWIGNQNYCPGCGKRQRRKENSLE